MSYKQQQQHNSKIKKDIHSTNSEKNQNQLMLLCFFVNLNAYEYSEFIVNFKHKFVCWANYFHIQRRFYNPVKHLRWRVLANITVGIYLLKVSDGNSRRRCEICSKLTKIKVHFEHISHLVLVFLLLTLNM